MNPQFNGKTEAQEEKVIESRLITQQQRWDPHLLLVMLSACRCHITHVLSAYYVPGLCTVGMA